MSIDRDESQHVWEIMASTPKEHGGHSYYANLRVYVITFTMERAIELFRVEYPDARLHKVERRQSTESKMVIVDPKSRDES